MVGLCWDTPDGTSLHFHPTIQTEIISIPYGGSQASEFLLKLAQIKYPNFPAKVTKEQCTVRSKRHGCLELTLIIQTMRHKLCEIALDYTDKLRELADPEKMADADRIVQFPFVAPV